MALRKVSFLLALLAMLPGYGHGITTPLTAINITASMARFWFQSIANYEDTGSEIQNCGDWEYYSWTMPNNSQSVYLFMDDVCQNMTILSVNSDTFFAVPVDHTTLAVFDTSGIAQYQSTDNSDNGDELSGKGRGVLIDFPADQNPKGLGLFCTNMAYKDYMFLYKLIPFTVSNNTIIANLTLGLNKDLDVDSQKLNFVLPPNNTLIFSLSSQAGDVFFSLNSILPQGVQISFSQSPADNSSSPWDPSTRNLTLNSTAISVNITNVLAIPQNISLEFYGTLAETPGKNEVDYLPWVEWMIKLTIVWILIFLFLIILCCLGNTRHKNSRSISYQLFDTTSSPNASRSLYREA